MVATAHGHALKDLRANSELNTLIGGFSSVVVGDAAVRAQSLPGKTITERAGKPMFDMLVEIRARGEFVVHDHVQSSVDALLVPTGKPMAVVSRRWYDAHGCMCLRFERYPHPTPRASQPLNDSDAEWVTRLLNFAKGRK